MTPRFLNAGLLVSILSVLAACGGGGDGGNSLTSLPPVPTIASIAFAPPVGTKNVQTSAAVTSVYSYANANTFSFDGKMLCGTKDIKLVTKTTQNATEKTVTVAVTFTDAPLGSSCVLVINGTATGDGGITAVPPVTLSFEITP